MPTPARRKIRHRTAASRVTIALSMGVLAAACGPHRLAVIGPIGNAAGSARGLRRSTELVEPIRIDFSWQLNEAGSRLSGVGVARVEPPYRARLDLFLENHESLLSVALVDDDLRLSYGARDDILPPVDLMWATLGVFRPLGDAVLVGGDRLEGDAQRIRYRHPDGTELHYEVAGGTLRLVELLEGDAVVQWVRVAGFADGRYPREATYRNLLAYRELKITRKELRRVESFDPTIWDPRE